MAIQITYIMKKIMVWLFNLGGYGLGNLKKQAKK